MTTAKREPSEFALKLLEGMHKAANEEVRKHLAEGRSVHGYENGKLVELKPKK